MGLTECIWTRPSCVQAWSWQIYQVKYLVGCHEREATDTVRVTRYELRKGSSHRTLSQPQVRRGVHCDQHHSMHNRPIHPRYHRQMQGEPAAAHYLHEIRGSSRSSLCVHKLKRLTPYGQDVSPEETARGQLQIAPRVREMNRGIDRIKEQQRDASIRKKRAVDPEKTQIVLEQASLRSVIKPLRLEYILTTV